MPTDGSRRTVLVVATADFAAAPRAQPALPEGRRDWFAPWRGRWPQLVDVAPALAIAVMQIVGTIGSSHNEPDRWALDAFAFIPVVAGPLALLFRRRWPEATLAVAFAAAAGYASTGYAEGPGGFLAFIFAVISAMVMGRRAFVWGVLVAAYPAFTWGASIFTDEPAPELGEALAGVAWMPLIGAASEIVRTRRERRVERAHTQAEESRRRASEERLLIARELHDVLAHNISLINVQAGVALHLLDERPDQARPALTAIKDASKEALGELRSVLDVLRRGGDADGGKDDEPTAPRAPTAGLGDIDGLVERTRATGLDVILAIEGEARPVPAGVDLAAFRIAQEALTNVVRHADAARATVRLTYGEDALTVQVDDDGTGSRSASVAASSIGHGPGRGIAGMRERALALGGSLEAGPRPGRGFRVRARLPIGRID
jgi:signal transduction histidine kinase